MSIEQIGGYNKLPSKDLRDVSSRRGPPEAPRTAEPDRSDRVEIVQNVPEDALRAHEASQGKGSDRVDITSAVRDGQGREVRDLPEKVPVDSLELSWRDPESVQRIRELVQKIREYKSEVSKRIEAARIQANTKSLTVFFGSCRIGPKLTP